MFVAVMFDDIDRIFLLKFKGTVHCLRTRLSFKGHVNLLDPKKIT